MAEAERIPAFAFFLFAAVVLYGLFGSPTPDDPGWTEIVVAVLLVFSVGAAGLRKSIDFSHGKTVFLKSLQVLFLCGLIVPTLAGVYYGHDKILILRDLLAFAFLGLPLFFAERLQSVPRAVAWLEYVMVFAGVAFAFRTLLPVLNVWIPDGELLYLSNSPLVLFSAVLVTGLMWASMTADKINFRDITKLLLCLGLGILMIAAMVLDVQRATIGAVFASLLVLMLWSLVVAPRRVVLPVLLIALFCAAFFPFVYEVANAIAQKTAMVGFNARIAEAKAVAEVMRGDPLALFVGQGWGATFSSPAVAGLEVNYTHSLLTTMFFKGGLPLAVLSVLMVFAALYQIVLIFQRDRVRGLALFWCVLIPALLYASHKSLDFGLILLMLGVWSVPVQALQSPGFSDRKMGS